MKQTGLLLSLALLAAPSVLAAQSPSFSSSQFALDPIIDGGGQAATSITNAPIPPKAFSQLAFGAGISTMGINLQAATNVNRYTNIRFVGNVFQYTANNISAGGTDGAKGFNIDAKVDLATAGVALDFYPLKSVALRFSPGVLFLNNNNGSGAITSQPGASFTLNNTTYYTSTTNPVLGNASLGLNTTKPAFTLTTGWGNMIPRKGGHFSFPVELGVAFIGDPSINLALTSGQVCNAQGQNCVNVATDPDVQANLQAQIAKYKNDLDPLKTFPIFSFGVAYNFHIR
jgi:hypothetical protein